jgi:acetyltransferase-like isoleucine patch superfamily enzyme
MDMIDISLDGSSLKRLQDLGCKMPTMMGRRSLHVDSFLEPPVAVLAQVEEATFLQVGAFTSVSGGKIGGVKIGRYCAIAPEVQIGAYEHPTDWLTCSRIAHYPVVHGWDEFCRPDAVDFIRKNTKHFKKSRPVTTLGHDVWIGQGAFIRSGVTLGTGCIVGARSVVVKDVPPYAIVAGMPATIKRYRFDERTIERLLALQWWRYSMYDCFQVPFDNIDAALDQLEDLVARKAIEEYQPRSLCARDLARELQPA